MGAMTPGDIAIIGTLGTFLVSGIVMLIKAGPAWNQSVAKNLRDELEAMSHTLEDERAGRGVAEKRVREETNRSERYRVQLIRAGVTPFDEASDVDG